MDDCDEIIEGFEVMERRQNVLADAAPAQAIEDMHHALADFARGQAALAEEICEDA